MLVFVGVLLVLLCFVQKGEAFFQVLNVSNKLRRVGEGNPEIEKQLISAITADPTNNRLSNSEQIISLVKSLEDSRSGIEQPAISPKVYGRWKLIHTTNADTSSPIQRKAVDASKFDIYQDIIVNDREQLVVSQVVKFSDTAQLNVDALASTSAYPLPKLQPRESDGKILGLNILGVSFVGEDASPDPTRPDSRINFVFDEGKFDFNGFTVPYPVPFRWPIFRDAVKGWIDITYLSDKVRIARGNKGTTFVLVRENAFDNI